MAVIITHMVNPLHNPNKYDIMETQNGLGSIYYSNLDFVYLCMISSWLSNALFILP